MLCKTTPFIGHSPLLVGWLLLVVQLITTGSVDENILERSMQKARLNYVMLGEKSSSSSNEETDTMFAAPEKRESQHQIIRALLSNVFANQTT
jgi:hypothetical protein